MIYLDYAATTPISDKALDMYNQVSKNYFGNPNSLHDIGTTAADILNTCREELASLFHGEARGVYFTSGGSDSNYLAIQSLVKGYTHNGKHIITTEVEHSSVSNTFKYLEEAGYVTTYLPVNEYGQVAIEDVKNAVRDDTILVSICHANSEIGTIQPIEEIGAFLYEQKIIFHSDCVQSFGKIPLDIKKAKLDSISISSHKIYGPKGVGASFISPTVAWKGLIPQTTHEKGFRPGTVNVPGIAAFVTAAQEIHATMGSEAKRYRGLSEKLVIEIKDVFPAIVVEGHPLHRLPHHLGLRIPGMEGQYALLELNRQGIAISTGTACQLGQQNPSKTLLAIGRSKQEAYEFIRITLGHLTTEKDIEETIQAFYKILENYFSL